MLRQAAKSTFCKINQLGSVSRTAFVTRAVASRSFATSSNRIAIDGNEAAARSAYMAADTAMIFPITPSSPMGEQCDNWAAHGKKNIFGLPMSITEMEVFEPLLPLDRAYPFTLVRSRCRWCSSRCPHRWSSRYHLLLLPGSPLDVPQHVCPPPSILVS